MSATELTAVIMIFTGGFWVGFLLGRRRHSDWHNNTPAKPRTEEEATDFLIAQARCSSTLSFNRQKMYIEAMLKHNQEVRELRKKYQ